MFNSRWWVVFASLLALLVGNASICMFATGVFIKPISAELHLGRGVISSAMGLENLVMSLMVPFIGRLLDRRGIRPVLLPLIVWFALSTAALSLLSSSVVLLMVLFAVQGIGGAGQGPTPYSKMVTSRFDENRGLALGITLAGVGLGTALMPQLARILLRQLGWRMGYVGLSVAILLLAFIPVAIWFGEPSEVRDARQQGRAPAQSLPGLELSEALRTRGFWFLVAAISLSLMAINGTLVHVVPMLTDRGLPLAGATAAMSAAGVMLIAGRILAGYLLDKIFASYVAIFFLLCPMVGIAILGIGVTGAGPVVGTVLLGLGVGAEHDLASYMLSRYFGIKAFGAMHGFLFMFAGVAVALGSMMLGWCFQIRHSYGAGLVLFEILLVVSIVLMAVLGPYRYPAVKRGARPRPKKVLAAQ